VSGLSFSSDVSLHVAQYTEGLSRTFNISLWTLIVPVLTGILIARRVSSLITLFLSAIIAGIVALILQPHILCEVSGEVTQAVKETADGIATTVGNTDGYSLYSMFRGLIMTYYGSTAVDTGNAELNELVSTGGMAGMMNTIWLIISAMFFGSMMVASRMIMSITKTIIRIANSCFSLVSSTVGTCLFLNLSTGDQFISIVLAADMYKDAYKQRGFESRLLSRTTEDAATVTSVLIPWNTCGMAQSTVLGVPTVVYLPYCFFNLLSPLMSMLVAAIGWKIKRLPVSGNDTDSE
jgi:NhaC family Na+:H+ antiporter